MSDGHFLSIGNINFINCNIDELTTQKLRRHLQMALEKLSLNNLMSGSIDNITIDVSQLRAPRNAHDLAEFLTHQIGLAIEREPSHNRSRL